MISTARRLITVATMTTGLALTFSGISSADTPSAVTFSTGVAPAAATPPTVLVAIKNIQAVLKDIQATKKPADLDKKLDKNIATLKNNEKATPVKVKKEYDQFLVALQTAKGKHQLTGTNAATVLKKISTDAKKLSTDLDAATKG